MTKNKITINTFKKLFDVKKGGAEFFRLVAKISVWMVVMGAMFYGLLYIPNQQLSIENAKIQIQVAQVQRQCELSAQNNLTTVSQLAKKEEKIFSKEESQKILVNGYNQCIFYSGMDFLKAN